MHCVNVGVVYERFRKFSSAIGKVVTLLILFFTGSLKAGEILCFIVFTLFTTLLVLYEMYQVAVLRKQYMQMENFIEWFVFISAIFTPFVKVYLAKIQIPLFMFIFYQLFCHLDVGFRVARNVCAVGICVAWLEFIFIFGRLPLKLSGGHFTVMYYNVIKNIFNYLLALLFMVIGYGLAFMITHQCLGIQF